jgi:hypothetical protein
VSSSSTEPQWSVASILVIANDSNIESLVGQLVAFAGHRPIFDVTGGAGGESVRLFRPAVALIDTSLPRAVVRACLSAADEVGSRPVLISGTASTSELAEEARRNGCLYFALPGGPKPLANVLARALQNRRPPAVTAVPERRRAARPEGPMHPALCAALAGIARARAHSLRAQAAIDTTHADRERRQRLADDSDRRSHSALRAAVVDYTRQLKATELPMDRVLSIVSDSIAECAVVVGAEPAIPALLLEAEGWTREAYRAA